MKRFVTLLVVVGLLIGFLANAANVLAHPYSEIAQRNAFALNTYVAPEPVWRSEPVPLCISGFVKRGDENTRVLLVSRAKDPKEGMRFYRLSEGEIDAGVKVVRIGPKQELVDGAPVVLTVKSNCLAIGNSR